MSGILVRIRIVHVKGADIAYFYEKEILDKLGLSPTQYDAHETFFNVGDEFQLGDERYRVVSINTKFFDETHKPHNYGINIYGIGEMLPFNFQITYNVETVE